MQRNCIGCKRKEREGCRPSRLFRLCWRQTVPISLKKNFKVLSFSAVRQEIQRKEKYMALRISLLFFHAIAIIRANVFLMYSQVRKGDCMGNGQKKAASNTKVRDNGAKLIFDDPVLCAEFLRGYVDVDLLKNVRPEDIEDISERFLPLWQEGRDSDSVKKIRLPDSELYLIAIVEHQSKVYYDMAFKLLRYIVLVLTDYENEQEKLHKGITKTKGFKYLPVLPIVYYEGASRWTAAKTFHEKVHLSDVIGKYVPEFEYLVVPLTDYTNQDLIWKT